MSGFWKVKISAGPRITSDKGNLVVKKWEKAENWLVGLDQIWKNLWFRLKLTPLCVSGPSGLVNFYHLLVFLLGWCPRYYLISVEASCVQHQSLWPVTWLPDLSLPSQNIKWLHLPPHGPNPMLMQARNIVNYRTRSFLSNKIFISSLFSFSDN